MTIQQDVQKLEPGALVELFVLDATTQGGGVVRFHKDTTFGSIWWQGEEYSPWPIEASGFSKTTEKPPTPKLMIGNVDGSISVLCRALDDLAGAKIVRKTTFARYLDARNFPGPNRYQDSSFTVPATHNAMAGVTIGDNGIELNRTTTDVRYGQLVTGLTVGKTYTVTLDIASNNIPVSNMIEVRVGSSHSSSTVALRPIPQLLVGRFQTTFVATATSHWVTVWNKSPNSKLVVRQTLVQEAGVNPEADYNQHFEDETWFIERKVTETKELVEFELASPLDLNGVQLPRRQIVANYCSWKSIGGYRGPYCGYTGVPVADKDDNPTNNPALDDCSGRLSSCRLRQWPGGVLNFGGFPAAGLMRS